MHFSPFALPQSSTLVCYIFCCKIDQPSAFSFPNNQAAFKLFKMSRENRVAFLQLVFLFLEESHFQMLNSYWYKLKAMSCHIFRGSGGCFQSFKGQAEVTLFHFGALVFAMIL